MDTNSIQPIENNELAIANRRLATFEQFFLKITNAFGLLPISLIASFVLTTVGLALPQFSFYGWSIIWTYGIIGAIASAISIVTWTLMKSFGLPQLVRLSISIWTPSVVGMVLMIPMFTQISWGKFFSDVVFLMFMIPAIAGGIIALLPYFYHDYLESKKLAPYSSNELLDAKNDDREL